MLNLIPASQIAPGANFLRVGIGTLLMAALLFGTGCRSATKQLTDPIIGPSYVPSNFYSRSETLPLSLRRVAVLPITFSDSARTAESVEDLLQSALVSEFGKAGRFELLLVRPDQVQQWSGKSRWNYQEALPAEFLRKVHQATGSDAVLFVHLAHYHPYRPIVMGWRMHLVTAEHADVIWSIDEVFDAGEEPVSNAARRYSREHLLNHPTLEESRSILLSPRRFAQYTLSAVARTLPSR